MSRYRTARLHMSTGQDHGGGSRSTIPAWPSPLPQSAIGTLRLSLRERNRCIASHEYARHGVGVGYTTAGTATSCRPWSPC